jgi:hypothetical protein
MAFDTTAPRRDDSYNNSLFKLAQYYHTVCPASDSQPFLKDSDQVLLIKILRAVNACGPFSGVN